MDQAYLDFVIESALSEDNGFYSDGNASHEALSEPLDNGAINPENLWFGVESSPIDFESPDQTASQDGYGVESPHQGIHRHQVSVSSTPEWWTPNSGDIIPNNALSGDVNGTARAIDIPLAAATHSESSVLHTAGQPTSLAKSGARLNRDSVRILKKWLSEHGSHPYADDTDKRMLQEQTGLSKTQIANWLANARRRGKLPSSRSSSRPPSSRATRPIDVPARPGTPAIRTKSSQMNPLQRWVDSPPEHEPASASAIARAVASSSSFSPGLNDPRSLNYAQDGSEKSLYHASSGTSVDTSCSSGGSFASATSHLSHASPGSLRPFVRPHSRRRKRGFKSNDVKTSLAVPRKTFQCTFCTETFGAKHDWQRHEHALHLPLERWVCAPEGPSNRNPNTGEEFCVFCGQVNPDDAHIQSHNYTLCQERSIHWRTFNRKDHLNQHLRLVHNTKFTDLMKTWKVPMPEIQSRCGFCESALNTWDDRVHHLANHFKSGKTMADWKGGWGFEPHIQVLVENSIPPYFIDTERNSPFPFEGSRALAETPRSAYELIKLELAYFMQNYFNSHARMPTSAEMQLEACRIILASESAYQQELSYNSSWLQDLIISDAGLFQKAKFGPMRSAAESRLFSIKITGKTNLFDDCPFEAQLRDLVSTQQTLGFPITESALKEEACSIVGRMEEVSTTPSDFIATWLIKLIHSSSGWLSGFVSRAKLPVSNGLVNQGMDGFDATIKDYTKLDREIAKYIVAQRNTGVEPTDDDLRRQAQIIIYGSGRRGGQTAADDKHWLSALKQRHAFASSDSNTSVHISKTSSPYHSLADNQQSSGPSNTQPRLAQGDEHSIMEARSVVMKAGSFFISDPNFYRWITEELTHWVKGTMSPQNPNCHVPSDAEIQHYARWITYNDDDPLNQTIAENQDWLEMFKRDMGILEN
ncbi:hypothetical protein BGZ63DRAFT_489736 [Mariannaea sp. PMI_226]|nr:hypothetical protein BGZ63DRAFT_489736 [Mariannaea sp. PMI_226]